MAIARKTENNQVEIPEIKLWKAVLSQLIQDAFSNTYESKERSFKQHARDYLKHIHRDFAEVCQNAGFDPSFVHRKVLKEFNKEFLKKIGANYAK